MTDTRRKPPPKPDWWVNPKQNKDGTVRDGSPTRASPSCESHGGCPYCESNRMYRTRKREPLVEDE